MSTETALDASKYNTPGRRDMFNGYLIRQVAVNIGLTCGWERDPPSAFTTAQLRVGISQTAGLSGTDMHSFSKATLYELAAWLDGVTVSDSLHDHTTRALRASIGAEAGVEYDPDRSTAEFRKEELQSILMTVAEQDLREEVSA